MYYYPNYCPPPCCPCCGRPYYQPIQPTYPQWDIPMMSENKLEADNKTNTVENNV